jgi:hypothetical protein
MSEMYAKTIEAKDCHNRVMIRTRESGKLPEQQGGLPGQA